MKDLAEGLVDGILVYENWTIYLGIILDKKVRNRICNQQEITILFLRRIIAFMDTICSKEVLFSCN